MARARKIVGYAVGLALAGTVAFDLYARAPADFAVTPLGLEPTTRSVVLLFHGSRGRDEPALIALERRMRELAGGSPAPAVVRYIWSPWSDARFRAGANGAHVGQALGAELATLPGLRSVHLVGHSAGAYPLEPLCEALRAEASHPVRVEMTYLDPIGFKGTVDTGWGARSFGACADYAEAFINTDDPVPATNAPLARAWNVDVTGVSSPLRTPGDGHRWPVRFYRDHIGAADIDGTAHSHDERPRGAVVKP
jgi:hypothetical protein